MTSLDILNRIMARDPDGGETEPTAQQYARFKLWAVGNYGLRAYDDYMQGNWGHVPDE